MDPVLYLQGLLLPLNVPVLLPGEFTVPQQHKKLGAPNVQGLRSYLADLAPRGYVQTTTPTGLLGDGVTDQGLQLLDIIAPGDMDNEVARANAQALAMNVRQACGYTPRHPTRLRFIRDQTSGPIETGIWRIQQAYTLYTAFGQA
ncbi:hypothetical protein [Deinococcus aquiradiocola]|nr:hypothetical protein [Deinococcus aquiradiocola]